MWNIFKRLAILPLLGLMWLNPSESEASHLMGIDLTYECINNCTIRVHLRAYRDCGGSSSISPTPMRFNLVNGSCPLPTPVSGWSAQVTTEVTPICASVPTRCTTSGAAINGVQEFYWYRDYDICSSRPCTFSLSWTTCCRNPAITTLNSPGSQSMYIGSTTFNSSITPCNNSPYFTNPPVPYICNGQPYTFNQGAYDPEGDSLSYSLGPCYTSNSTSVVPYASGVSATAPLGPTWSVVINPTTGDITITPTPGSIQVGVLCVYVTEWRNGSAINTIVRDIQITVISCPNNTLPTMPGVTNVTGGIRDNNTEVTVCAGTQLDFDMPMNDPDVGQQHTVYWNSNLAGLGGQFYLASNINIQDTATGNRPTTHFQWTPQTIGTYTFLITLQDDACPIIGQNQYTITINVIGGLLGATATATPTGCTNVAFSASPGSSGTGPFTYQWSGDGNILVNPQNNQQNFNHTFPGPGTYQWRCIITDSYGCQAIIDTVVNIPSGPTANAGPDISVCSGYTVQLGSNPLPNHTYSWIPGTGLSATNISNPTFTMTNNTSTPDTVNFVLSATEGFCTSLDYVTVIVYPTPQAAISGNLNICEGTSTTLTASGGTRYVWSTGDTTNSITVSPTQNTTYTVTAVGNGCSSLPATATVVVSRGPAAIVTGPDKVCPGDNANLTVVGGTSWLWSTGSTNQTITLPNLNTTTTVTVIPSQGGCAGPAVSYTVDIHEKPIADFNNTTVCEGLETTFNDNSTISTGTVITWSWNFGDINSGPNNFSNSQNPTHTYTSPGIFNTQLIVTSSNGCKDTIVKAVTVNPLPQTDFEFEDVCEGETMQFQDLTPGNNLTNWSWNFNDGSTSNQQNPSHTYANPGAYNVTLTVTNANGCTKSKTRTVFVHPNADPDFSYVNTCFNTITEFTNLSTLNDPYGTEIGAYQWNFGDPQSGAANTSGQINPTHSYPGPGNYSVSLTVITTKGCQFTITRNIVVGELDPLVVDPDTICRGYSAFLSVSNNPQGTVLEWYYTKNGTGQPFHIGRNYTTPPLDQSIMYWVGLYDPADGCRSPRVPIWVKVWSPPSIQMEVQRELEIPNAIAEFNVTRVQTSSAVASYYWEFGDGTSSGAMNPVHQYTDEGVYTVTLTVTDVNGCETFYEFNNWIEVTQNVRLYIPNAFTPNGDGINDEFFISTRLITDIQISIFDRWGKVVFESEDPNFRWAGKFGGEDLPEGVYAYKINATAYDGEKFSKSGSISIIR